MNENLIKYLGYFKSLNRGFNKGFGKAPHKPILLLSILKLSEQGKLPHNRIEVSSDLVVTFKDYFKALVKTGHIDTFSLPFFHLKSEPFYRLIPKNGMRDALKKTKSIKSINKLSELVAFAEIDKALFALIADSETRILMQSFLIKEYFPNHINKNQLLYGSSEDSIENEILKESKISYQTKLSELESKLDKNSFEEEMFIRGGVFKKTVPKIYNYSCCVTGLKVSTNYNIQMVDACHIIPFSISQDDTIQNGVSLSPNIHRAFDRGLLTINQDYIVRISPSINRELSSDELISLEGKTISLPKKEKYFPSQEALEWHRREVFLF